MINHAVCTVCNTFSHGMIHEVGRELAGRSAAIFQTPDNPVRITLVIDFHNTDTVLWFNAHVLQKLSASGRNKVFSL